MTQVRVTVAVCTWNPPAIAAHCLRRAAEVVQRVGPRAEFLIVNNDPASQPPVLSRVAGARLIHEPRLGLSHARNTALREAHGEIVAFIDDDVEVTHRWLTAHLNAYERHATICVGGPVALQWPQPHPPRWYTRRLATLYSGIDHGTEPREVGRHELPIGANMSVRREAAHSIGGFSSAFGRRGNSLRSGEDTDFTRRILARFPRGVLYEPNAAVVHHVKSSRCRWRWLIRRAAAAATTEAALLRQEDRLTSLSVRRLLKVRYSHPTDPIAAQATDVAVRATTALAYWWASRT